MSQIAVQRRQTVAQLMKEHDELTALEVSPFIEQMEEYYFRKPKGYAMKVRFADWIPKHVRIHIIRHVRALFFAYGGGRKTRRIKFREFARSKDYQKAENFKFSYTKKTNGQMVKRSKENGRFVRFSEREREAIKSGKTT